MVADMTTFMAKLVSKLTQTSINFANSIVAKADETKRLQNESEDELASWQRFRPLYLNQDDLLNFQSNSQLLDDNSLSIPGVVLQVQNLAKKHVESLQLMHEFGNNTLQHILNLSSAKHHAIDKLNSVR